eukprot:1195297-Prorocentrum_minimum.AAC.2
MLRWANRFGFRGSHVLDITTANCNKPASNWRVRANKDFGCLEGSVGICLSIAHTHARTHAHTVRCENIATLPAPDWSVAGGHAGADPGVHGGVAVRLSLPDHVHKLIPRDLRGLPRAAHAKHRQREPARSAPDQRREWRGHTSG